MVRFGLFEFDSQSVELRRRGLRIHLLGQPALILSMLLERPGELLSREEIQKKLWPADTFVDFEHSLNAAMKRLRRALGDSPNNPRFIETLPRRGYRFIAPVERPEVAVAGGRLSAPIDSLAVLPFANTASDPETEYLTDGITESIINSLSQLSGVRVMARSTVFRYKDRDLDPRLIGRQLNVQAVLIGRVLPRGENLVIGAELVEVSSGWRLWGEQYNRGLADILNVEEEISREISGKLRIRLTGEDRSRLAKRYTRSADAHADYLKGRYCLNKMTEAGLLESIGFYRQALEKDSGYTLAYAGLAETYILCAFFPLKPPAEMMPLAKEAALKALALDDTLAEAHVALASVKKFHDWDWRTAEAECQRALALNPNHANAHRLYASLLASQGRTGEALPEILRARELDPLSLVIGMEVGWHCFMGRDYEGAVRHASSTLAMEPAFPSSHYVLGLAYEQQGRLDEAIAAFQKACAGAPGNPAPLSGLGHALALTGRSVEAESLLRELTDLGARAWVPPYFPALVVAGQGRTEAALACLEEAFRKRDPYLVWLKCDPRFDAFRREARFVDLLRRVGLAG
ncbi:MAG TPA: tetratricopeptide repeat protein [Bryobacteraceae bacterium]|nr:tetratricopeptide repeat protein [Bryobacteraceae bacterium]